MATIKERLEKEEQDEELVKLRDMVVSKVRRSRSSMSKHYEKWDRNNDVYRGVKTPDDEDLNNREHNEMEKFVVPMTFAQVQTFVAFLFLLYHQNRRFFELAETGPEDTAKFDAEKILERDLRRNQWSTNLYQFLTNVGRFSLGVVKTWYVTEKQWAPTNIEASSVSTQGFEFQTEGETSTQEFVSYQGNRISNISPYNFFPDPSFSLVDAHKGTFMADESEWHINDLKKRERDGTVGGVEHIELMTKDGLVDRKETRLEAFTKFTSGDEKSKDNQIVVITECQMDLVPAKYGLGEETYPVKYVVEVANDQRVISASRLGYLHNEPTYDIGLFSPDMHQQLGESLADSIDAMQDVVSHLINSRLMSVNKSLENNMVVDPSGVDMASVESRSPWIKMKKGSPRLGVDKFIRQLNYTDTTGSNFNDAEVIIRLMQMVTGVNENAMGQFHGGRRSATEARAVNGGAASRLKVIGKYIWDDCLSNTGRKMLSNHRQGLSLEGFKKVIGNSADIEERYRVFKPADPSELVGAEDYFVHDSTLESEKGFIAQSLQELVSAMMQSPEVAAILPLDIGELMKEILRLRGIENVDRFERQPVLPQNAPGLNLPGAGPVPAQQGATGINPFQG